MNARATRFPLFDSLRAIAALCIFGTHVYAVLQGGAGGTFGSAAQHLDVGVYIFFAISGFLLYRPFVRARLRDETPPRARAYGWRRILRIGPAYWVALTVVAIWLPLGEVNDLDKAPWLYLFGQSYQWDTAIGGLSQAWSLCVEAGFYVFLPIWAFGMRSLPLRGARSRLRAELAGLGVLALAGFAFTKLALVGGAVDEFGRWPLHLTLPCFLQVFAIGMCIAVLSVWYEDRELPRWLRPVDRFPAIPWVAALAAFWVTTQLSHDGHEGRVNDAHYLERTALYAIVGAGIVLPAVFGDQARGLVRRLLANRALLGVGLVSYSLFLYHVAVLVQVKRWDLPAGTLVALAGSLAIATLSYYAIERPALRLKRLVKARPDSREAIAEPAPVTPPRVTQPS
ncbi:MAG TPA: acyltransferase [Thermoleophilaceae bacterium]|nr:acyltransferase [Thermoleophilaceae bacterium]